ncbi:sulfotransferase [Roseivivax sediminis]|uniref:Glycosyltransferase like family protein n=1 Tax=Roseivivax sediminis TaxID=936889 RepID=A0A1I2AC07_9RHOB|nr:sulfotransferase [Roseivivax sediminis]SFE41426.1 Glycosyltransferase like family protein [Roseivivax sediminis]
MTGTAGRQLPALPRDLPAPTRPISFVCVRYSAEFTHNLRASGCVHDPMNELVVVDNRRNIFFPTLGAALVHGIGKARHDLVALVHEDVLLLDGWQAQFEASLRRLEEHYPDWGMVGAVGRATDGTTLGHWSDPATPEPRNTLAPDAFAEVDSLDDQLMVLRRSNSIHPDPALPGIHNIGPDLVIAHRERGLRSFVVDAPSVHKFADGAGQRITSPGDSRKLRTRGSLTWQAEADVSRAWFDHKHGRAPVRPGPAAADAVPQPPVILIGRGGGGTRLVSLMAQDCGLFIGSQVNISGDSIEMVPAIYRSVLRKLKSPDPWSVSQIVPDLRAAAAAMLDAAGGPDPWGFKLPESALLLPELDRAFPGARFVHFRRSNESTVFRRTHMTARLDNEIGRATVPAAYDHIGRRRALILTDGDLVRMAATTRHQTDLIDDFLSAVPDTRRIQIDFDETVAAPEASLARLARFLDREAEGRTITDAVDQGRAASDTPQFPDADVTLARSILTGPLHKTGHSR